MWTFVRTRFFEVLVVWNIAFTAWNFEFRLGLGILNLRELWNCGIWKNSKWNIQGILKNPSETTKWKHSIGNAYWHFMVLPLIHCILNTTSSSKHHLTTWIFGFFTWIFDKMPDAKDPARCFPFRPMGRATVKSVPTTPEVNCMQYGVIRSSESLFNRKTTFFVKLLTRYNGKVYMVQEFNSLK